MQTLADILSGIPANPYQTAPGVGSQIMQQALLGQMSPGMLGQPGAIDPSTGLPMQPGTPPGMQPQGQGIGSLGSTALPPGMTAY